MFDQSLPYHRQEPLFPSTKELFDAFISEEIYDYHPDLAVLFNQCHRNLLIIVDYLLKSFIEPEKYFPEITQKVIEALDQSVEPEILSNNGPLSKNSVRTRITYSDQPSFITLSGKEVELTSNFTRYLNSLSELDWNVIKYLLVSLPTEITKPDIPLSQERYTPIFSPIEGLLELARHDEIPGWLDPSNLSIFIDIYPQRRAVIAAKGVGIGRSDHYQQSLELQRIKALGSMGMNPDSVITQRAAGFMSQILHDATNRELHMQYLKTLMPFSALQATIDDLVNNGYLVDARATVIQNQILNLCREREYQDRNLIKYSADLVATILLRGRFRGEIYELTESNRPYTQSLIRKTEKLRELVYEISKDRKDLLIFGQAFAGEDSVDMSYALSEITHAALNAISTSGVEMPPLMDDTPYEAALQMLSEWILEKYPSLVNSFIMDWVMLSRLVRANPLDQLPGHKYSEFVIPIQQGGFYRCDILITPADAPELDRSNPAQAIRSLRNQEISIIEIKNRTNIRDSLDKLHINQVQNYVSALLEIEPTLIFDKLLLMHGTGAKTELIDIRGQIDFRSSSERGKVASPTYAEV